MFKSIKLLSLLSAIMATAAVSPLSLEISGAHLWTYELFNAVYYKLILLNLFIISSESTFSALVKEMPVSGSRLVPSFFFSFAIMYVFFSILHLFDAIRTSSSNEMLDRLIVVSLVFLSLAASLYYNLSRKMERSMDSSYNDISGLVNNVQRIIKKNNDRINKNKK